MGDVSSILGVGARIARPRDTPTDVFVGAGFIPARGSIGDRPLQGAVHRDGLGRIAGAVGAAIKAAPTTKPEAWGVGVDVPIGPCREAALVRCIAGDGFILP